MNAEIIAVGTEILMGMITDTNSMEISQALTDLGINIYYHQTVGDNVDRMIESLDLALSRSDVVILSGGLGPTRDDITKEVVAKHVGEKLIVDQSSLEKIETYFAQTNRQMTELDITQAQVAENSTPLFNTVGLAVGFAYETDTNQHIIVLPGVPYELREMLKTGVIPYLTPFTTGDVLDSLYLQFTGLGEAQIAYLLDDLIESQSNPSIAMYANPGKVTIRLTASGPDHKQLNQTLADKIIKRLDAYFIGYGQTATLEEKVVQLLKKHQHTVSSAESLTAGNFSGTLGNVSGASDVLFGGVVTYQTDAKIKLLNLSKDLINKESVVSHEVAQNMADHLKQMTQTDFAVSFTGVAGPNEWDGHPVGDIYIGISFPNGKTKTFFRQYPDKPRSIIRQRAIQEALVLMRDYYYK